MFQDDFQSREKREGAKKTFVRIWPLVSYVLHEHWQVTPRFCRLLLPLLMMLLPSLIPKIFQIVYKNIAINLYVHETAMF